MGLQWHFEGENKPMFLFDSRLLFGSNKGPPHFHQPSQAICKCMMCKGFWGVVAYTDDFFIAAATYEECRKWTDILIKLLKKLGFLISWIMGKGKLQQQLQHFGACKRTSKQQLQSLASSLN